MKKEDPARAGNCMFSCFPSIAPSALGKFQCVRKIPPSALGKFLKLLCCSQPIMLRLWMIQVTFGNKLIPYYFASLTSAIAGLIR